MKNVFLSLLVTFILLQGSSIKAQHLTTSTYTRYGIGDLFENGFGQTQAMGGAGYALRSLENINETNPASFTSLALHSFIFEIGYLGRFSQEQTSGISQTDFNANLCYMAIAFPITKWWGTSIGLHPYSNVGYEIDVNGDGPVGSNTTASYKYSGTGGFNEFYIGNAFKIGRYFSVGFNAGYIFGTIQHISSVSLADLTGNEYDYTITNRFTANDIHLNYGIQFEKIFNEKYVINAGVILDNKSTIKAENSLVIEDYLRVNQSTFDTVYTTSKVDDKMTLPMNLGFGIAFSNFYHYTIAADYTMQDWSKANFFGATNSTFGPMSSFSIGAEYLPKAGSPYYFNNIRYRIGGHYTNTYYEIPQPDSNVPAKITDVGFSFGLGFPLRGSRSVFNVAFEFGQRGNASPTMTQERYAQITLNLSLHDLWFFKPKFE